MTSGLGIAEDLAVDWLTGNIYFTDSEMQHIGVCSNDGAHCSVLVNKDIDKPRAIVLDPSNGYNSTFSSFLLRIYVRFADKCTGPIGVTNLKLPKLTWMDLRIYRSLAITLAGQTDWPLILQMIDCIGLMPNSTPLKASNWMARIEG